MSKNNYSKFKYSNSYQVKFAVNPSTQKATTVGTEIRMFQPNVDDHFLGRHHLNIGQTIVTDYIYRCNQVNSVDQPMVMNKNAVKQVFFKFLSFWK